MLLFDAKGSFLLVASLGNLLHLPHEKDSDCDGSLRRERVWGGADGQDGADG